jgi:hypothetical protein
MGFEKTLRAGIKTAQKLLNSMEVDIYIQPWISQTANGTVTYGAKKKVRVLWDKTVRTVYADGREIVGQGTMQILTTMKANGAAGRQEPVDTRDLLVVVDSGAMIPILHVDGAIDPGTMMPYAPELFLGTESGR